MALINDQDASALNIHNLDSRYKQYSATLNELRDPNNLSYTNSNISHGVESVNTANTNVQQGVDLKEQLLNIISSNNQADNLKQVSFNSVQNTTYVDNIDDFPLDEIKVTCQKMPPLHTLTTDISKTLNSQTQIESDFNFVEEGHFHREAPQAKTNNLKRVRSRLLLDSKDSIFFDITGEVKNDAPTLRHIPPFFLNEPCSRAPFDADKSTTSYYPASIWTIENSNVARHIRVEISKIRFTSHELSSEQDLLSNQLQTLYDSCMSDIQFPKTEYFVQKIKAYREDLRHHPEKERELLEEIVECHNNRDIEEKKMCEKRAALLECWHMLKEARDRTKPTTTISLRWKAKKISEAEKQEEEALFNKDLLERAKEVSRLKLILTGENIETNEIAKELKENHEQMGLRMPGETKWIPILSESERAEFKELSNQEQNRFKHIAKTKISVGFFMGVYQVVSDDTQLTSDFFAYPDVGCHAIALHVPQTVKIHIFESGTSKKHEIASVTLPVFSGEPPVFTEYEFTSQQPLPDGRLVQGYLEGRCFVETDQESLETIIKDTREEYRKHETSGSVSKKRPICISNKLMNELVSKHDPNDPYLTAAIATMNAHRYKETEIKSFSLDSNMEKTLFASMAASDLWKQIPNRAYDMIRPNTNNKYQQREEKKLYDVVTQPPAATFSSFFKALLGFFKCGKKSRSISPMDANCTHRIEERSTVILHIHQILKIPTRYTEKETFSYTVGGTNTKDTKTKQPLKLKDPNILVRISLQGVEHTSAVVNGSAENFNKQIELHLVKEGEAIPNYQQIEGKTIRIDIFDEYAKEELQFIGTLQIPLRSVFINGMISGTFSINSPHFTMEHSISDTLSKLNITICLRPRLIFDRQPLPSPVSESSEVNDRAHDLWNTLHADFPNRNYFILVMTTEGRSYLPCRMATQQSITEINGFDELLAFISMIPTNSSIDKHDKSAWSTSDEVIENNNGTNIEHALLFCNILLGQNKNAFVVLGTDKIAGYEAYVLVIDDSQSSPEMKIIQSDDYLKKNITKEEKNKQKKKSDKDSIDTSRMVLYNPTNGRKYKLESEDLTLIDVTTVFNDKNVWFNIQSSETAPHHLNWNFENNKCWIPFFDKKFEYIELKSIQPTDLVIPPANKERLSYIKKKVKTIIMEAVESFRPQTKWFNQTSLKQSLKELLISRKEVESMKSASSKPFKDLMQETIQKFNAFRIVGSPFFISYVYDDDANDGILHNEVFDEIKKREICSCYLTQDGTRETQDTFYSFAVELKAFPNEIYAIWVLLVAIHPRETIDVSMVAQPVVNEAAEKKMLDVSQSDYYYDEEEEEEEKIEIRPIKGSRNNKRLPIANVHLHNSTKVEEEEENENTEFSQDKDSPKNKSRHSQNESEKHKSTLNSSAASPRSSKRSQNESEKHKSVHNSSTASPRDSKRSQNESEKHKSTLNSSAASPRSSKRSQDESEKNKSVHNSSTASPRDSKRSQNESEKQKSLHNSSAASPRDSKRSQNENENQNSLQNTSGVSPGKTSPVPSPRDSSLNKSQQAVPLAEDVIIEEEEEENDSHNEPVKKEAASSSKKAKDGEEDDSIKLSDDESSPRPVALNKILMLGEALEGSTPVHSPKAGSAKNEDKSSEKVNLSSKKDSKSNENSDDNDEKAKVKKLRTDEEGVLCVISDVTLSVPSPAVVKYSKRVMRDSKMRKRIYVNSDSSDENNDSVYQMKKKANKQGAFVSDVQTDLKKKRQLPTRRRNRNDEDPSPSPIKNQRIKGKPKSKVSADDEPPNNDVANTAVLLSSDSEN